MSRIVAALVVLLAALAATGCGAGSTPTGSPPPAVPAAALLPEAGSTAPIIRELEERVRRNPDDFMAYNKLAGYYQQRLRETGDVAYVDLALRASRASLEVLPAHANPLGLRALVEAEIAAHEFASAREHALELIRKDPTKAAPFALLGDACLELGRYDEAIEAYREAERRAASSVLTETRLARLAALHGRLDEASGHYARALVLALGATDPDREVVAWCRWQLGETAFAAGKLAEAEAHYRDALTTFPSYHRALASLGRARAGAGDLAGAIELYEQATKLLPDPTYVAALGDLYRLAGREREAAAEYALVEQIARTGQAMGALHSRQYALYLADHDLKAEEAYAAAAREYEARRDVYGADALAWTALKAGRIDEAKAAIADALRLGTKDARVHYHAGMIARAAGDTDGARRHLATALELNPHFDPLNATIARKAHDELAQQ